MPRRIVTVSYTTLDAGGGVPKFNRDLHAAFPDRETQHYCWWDFPWHPEADERGETEWSRARKLNEYLVRSRKLTSDDVVIADGFWGAGLEHLPLAVSHSHGIWSHLTQDDVEAGKTPDMPYHHIAQVEFRRRWHGMGKHLTAVSDFIAEQMRLQWGFKVDRVINNGVDTELYSPSSHPRGAVINPLIIHGVNDRSNTNKGWNHIELLQQEFGNVFSLDEACAHLPRMTKPQVLASADLVVHPSGYEGNSMFVAEALSCGVPIVGYDVGFLWKLRHIDRMTIDVGFILDRNRRSPEVTREACHVVLAPELRQFDVDKRARAREVAVSQLSIQCFRANWRSYVEEIENAA